MPNYSVEVLTEFFKMYLIARAQCYVMWEELSAISKM